MSDSTPPPPLPFPTPPSAETAAQHYLDVIHEMRELRRDVNQLKLDVGRAVDAATAAKLLIHRVAKHLGLTDA